MRVFIVAGEPSGDKLGAALMTGLQTLAGDVQFEGIGGPLMQDCGLVSRFDMSELSVMGIAEVLPRYRALMRRINETAAAVIDTAPDVLITIDSPDFCLRVARRVRAGAPGIRTVHYVAPTVWAWRPGRAAKMAEMIDHVLALFPFEPPLMQAAGMDCDFVGHPVVAEPVATAEEAAAFRTRSGIGRAPFVLVLPGSRRGEVTRLAPIFRSAVQQMIKERPDLRIVVPAAAPVAGLLQDIVPHWPGDPILLDPRAAPPETALSQKRAAFAAADVALAASGTVSLELAAVATPMVIAYDMNWFSRQIIARMLKVDTVTLVNLVSDTRVVPEFLGPRCKPDLISAAVLQVLDHPDAQQQEMEVTMQRLGRDDLDPGLRAAQSVLDFLA
ncbi:lipid-A-disaccharide synthase [Sulfitobacter sp. TBRI5]|uniref:lipid-A-disaccharide synthase n=1 Tax=Sulfitobacter sp. TBRI5 TaxID=2989732 RepID=UPI003D9B6B85